MAKVTFEDGSEAPQPGLQAGDHIVAMDGDSVLLSLSGGKITHFQDVAMVAALASPNEQYTFHIERTVDGQARRASARMGVYRADPEDLYAFGIAPADSLTVGDVVPGSPFAIGDRLVAVAGRKVEHSWDLEPIDRTLTGDPVGVTVRRDEKDVTLTVQPRLVFAPDVIHLTDGRILRGRIRYETAPADGSADASVVLVIRTADGQEVRATREQLSGESFALLGMTPRMTVLSVLPSSRAEEAGLQSGDVIVGYGDRGPPNVQEMLAINREFADAGTRIVVLRDGQTVPLWVVPKHRGKEVLVGIIHGPDQDHAVVAAVAPDSPAARLGIVEGAVITAVNGRPVTTWVDVFQRLRAAVGRSVSLTYRVGAATQTVELPKLTKDLFDPADYVFSPLKNVSLLPLMLHIRKANPIAALGWGARETLRMILSTYVSLRSIVLGYAPTEQLRGPLGIGGMAVAVVRERPLVDFIYFLAFISATVAVINFLPLPVVDGGHAVLLIIEKIRRKPVPVRIQNIVQLVGLAAILFVFVALTWQDLVRIFRDSW